MAEGVSGLPAPAADNEGGFQGSDLKPDSSRRQTAIKKVTLADGTTIDKQIADFTDKNESQDMAEQKAEYAKKMDNLKDEEKELYRLSEPIPLTNFMVNRPCCIIISGFVIMLAISIFVFAMGWLLPNDPNDRDYMVWGDEYVNNFDKSKLARSEILIEDGDAKVALQS